MRVTLFRDNHAWCPYCQKCWLWLEEKRVPYKVEKVTMFCYGEKEASYKRLVPSGMLPALAIDGRLITESDRILFELEREFGPLSEPISTLTTQRQLERTLFSSWCEWLCHPSRSAREEQQGQQHFEEVCMAVERELGRTAGPWFCDGFSTADVLFVPYVERMSASLFYYKGFTLRDARRRPNLCRWFDALEQRETYLGTQSDVHTHAHDLPPQMGGCYPSGTAEQRACAARVDQGPWVGLPDTGVEEPPPLAAEEAASRVMQHRDNVIGAHPADARLVDEALRCALTHLLTGESPAPPPGSDAALRYVRDRVNVPRDMSLWAARRLRQALEETAARAGAQQGPPIPVQHRRDQDPRPFRARA